MICIENYLLHDIHIQYSLNVIFSPDENGITTLDAMIMDG